MYSKDIMICLDGILIKSLTKRFTAVANLSLHQILKSYFGYDSFRPMQEEIINHVVDGNDALVLMPTGGGKSLCYQIPALAMEGTAIVVSPLISLMKDQVDALRSNGIASGALNSHNSDSESVALRKQCEDGSLKILYVSPERLIAEIPWLQMSVKVSMIAIDEAHCISQWGHDFRPEYTQMETLHSQFPDTPILALTATADKITKNDIVEQLNLKSPKIFVSSFDRPNLSLDVRRGYSSQDKLRVILDVIDRHPNESGVVFCLSRKGTEDLAEKLKQKGVSVGVYHAGLSSEERNRIQDDFINDRISVVCATIAFGMGIDKSNIRFVIHNNMPKSIESFYQEIGRAGRDGLPAETILFYNLQDIITLRKFAEDSGQKDINLEKLNRMQEYAESQVCRRRILLNYFGEVSNCQCGNCDVCKNPPQRFDGTIIVQKALSAIKRTDEQVGFGATVDILRGNTSPVVASHAYDTLKTFGAGRDVSARDWHDYLLQMLQMGYIEIAYDEDKHFKVTTSGNEILFGRQKSDLAVIVREDFRVKSKEERRKSKSERESQHSSDSVEDLVLFDKLRELRKTIAQENKCPAYIVMSDKTLHSIASERPTTIEAFGNVYGIGEHKKATLGARIVDFVNEYLKTNEQNPFAEFVGAKKSDSDNPEETLSYMDRQKQKYAQAYAPWTAEDDERLLHLHSIGTSIEDLMIVFGRNRGAIKSRIKKLMEK